MKLTILGLDAGFSLPGIAVLSHSLSDGLTMDWAAALQTSATSKKDRAKEHIYKSDDDARRVMEISDWLASAVLEFDPHHIVVELPSSGAKSAGGIRGMALAAATAVATFKRLGYGGSTLHFVTPGQNKKGSTGDRNAEKEAVLAAIKAKFPSFARWPQKSGPRKKPGPDLPAQFAAADAASAILTALAAGKIKLVS